jgi:Leucine-rich repeat (LRR) protein
MIYYLGKLKLLNRIGVEKSEITNSNTYFDGRITPEVLELKLGTDNTNDVVEADLANCKLKDSENIFGTNFPKLRKLNISRNMFSSFKIFGNCSSMLDLNLSHNIFERFLGKLEKAVSSKGLLGIMVCNIYFLFKFSP